MNKKNKVTTSVPTNKTRVPAGSISFSVKNNRNISSVKGKPVTSLRTVPRRKKPKILSDRYSIEGESHLAVIEGPIMFTAPHGLEVIRGGDGERTRVHKREKYTSEIVLKLSKVINQILGFVSTSFIIWNCKTAKKKDPKNLDPNYLVSSQFTVSPWNSSLRHWKKRFSKEHVPSSTEENLQRPCPYKVPLFHIDIHGKIDRKNNRDVDVGMMPMQVLWKDTRETSFMHDSLCNHLGNAFKTCTKKFGGFSIGVERDPDLHGFWGENTNTTMSHQSILLGIPSAQLEIPYSVRCELMENQDLFNHFALALVNTYHSCCKYYQLEWQNIMGVCKSISGTNLMNYKNLDTTSTRVSSNDKEKPKKGDHLEEKKQVSLQYILSNPVDCDQKKDALDEILDEILEDFKIYDKNHSTKQI